MTLSIDANDAGFFSELAYQKIGTPLVSAGNFPSNSFAGWHEIVSLPDSSTHFNLTDALLSAGAKANAQGVLSNQFRILTNGTQFVFAFKGSSVATNWYDDLVHNGSQAFDQLLPVVVAAIQAIQSSSYATSFAAAEASNQVFTDGHSLGGSLAQSIALMYSFNGYGQNSLPIASQPDSYIDDFLGVKNSLAVSNYQSAHRFIETNTDGDIASLYYPHLPGVTYLDSNPTKLPSPFSSSGELALIAAGLTVPGPATAGALVAAVALGGAAHSLVLNTNLSQGYSLTGDGHLNVSGPSNNVLAGDTITTAGNIVTVTDAYGNKLTLQSSTTAGGVETLVEQIAGTSNNVSVDPSTGDFGLAGAGSGAAILFRDTFDSSGDVTSATARYADGATYQSAIAANGSTTNMIAEGNAKDTFTIAVPSSGVLATTIIGGSGSDAIVIQNGTLNTPLGQNLTSVGNLTWSDGSGTFYTFAKTDAESDGVLTIQGSVLGANAQSSIVIKNFNLSDAESALGYMGIVLPREIFFNASANAGVDPPAPAFNEGTSQSYTLSIDAPSSAVQTFTVTLAGAVPTDFDAVVGDTIEQLGANGTFSVALAPGETNVAFTLEDTTSDNGLSDIANGATLTLSASIPNPDTVLGGIVQTTPLTFNYVPAVPDTTAAPMPSDPITGAYNNATGITTFNGDGGDDFMTGTGASNLFNAQSSGNDSIVGGTQANTINGGNGNSVLTLSGTANTVNLGSGFNTIYGGSGRDIIGEGSGDEDIVGNNATDLIVLGNGNSQIYAGSQVGLANAIAAAAGGTASGVQGDLIAVGDGNNTVIGGRGNDLIDVGGGHDVIVMGPGNDTFIGGTEVTQAVVGWSATYTSPTAPGGSYSITENNIGAYAEPFVNPYPQPYNSQGGGGAANDTIYGGTGNELLDLGNGNNDVELGSGADIVLGGMGNDTIIAGSGSDTIRGGGGTTYIEGSTGTELIEGGDGNNTVIGGSGNATISSANGPNGTLQFAGASLEQNYVTGGSGNDVIYGSAGTDTLIGGTGNVTIYGGPGTEFITGGSGNDSIDGGTGNDTISAGGAGMDSLYANGSSSSISVIYGGTGTDLIAGGSGANTLYAGDGGTAYAPTTVVASQTNDTATTSIYGGLGVDLLESGDGNAVIYGGDGGTSAAPTSILAGSGDTTVYGGLGTEIIVGGSGTDVLYAGDGGTSSAPETVSSGTGINTLYGGAGPNLLQDLQSGQDLLVSTSGDDTIIGIGDDTLVAGSGDDALQSNGGSVNFEFNLGFGDDTVQNTGGTENILFGNGIADTDFAGSITFDQYDNPDLMLVGDGGSIAIQGALTGALTGVAYVGASAIPLATFLTDVLGGDLSITNPYGGTDFISLANAEAVSLTHTNSLISSWGSGSTLSAAFLGTIYSAGSGALISSQGADQIISAGANATVNGGAGGNDQVTVSGANSLINVGLATGGDNLTSVIMSGTNDTLVSASGSVISSITVNNVSDVVQVASAAGATAIRASVSYTAPNNVASLTLIGSASISATGNSIADTLTGGAGVDTLVAGSGVATLIGGSGNTTFVVNSSSDVVQDSVSTASNAVDSSVSYTLGANINALVLVGTGALTGSANNMNDTLTSNSGVDTFYGGTGNDTFILNNASDVVVDSAGIATIQYGAAVSFTLPANSNTLTLLGSSAVHATGNSGNDLLTANSGSDTLSAGNGADTLISGLGTAAQSLVGGTGTDLFIINYAGDIVTVGLTHGTDTIESSVNYTASANVANLTLLGTAALTATGNTLVNVLTGNSGADTLTAGSGLATLIGGVGNDTFIVNNSSDVVQDAASTAANTINSSASFTAAANVNTLLLTGTSALTGTANGANDTLTSNSGADTLVGGSGNDTFNVTNTGVVIQDTYTTTSNAIVTVVSYSLPTNVNSLTFTGTSALRATANSGTDVLIANTGADTLVGGSGTDTLISGIGSAVDSLVGGTGNDLFVVNYAGDLVTVGATHGADTIQSAVSFTLPTSLNTLLLTGSANLTGAAVSGNNLVVGNAGNDTLKAGSGFDTLEAGSGLATLIGGSVGDTFVIDNAADVLSATAASNTVVSSVSYTMGTNVSILLLSGMANLVGTGSSASSSIYANNANDTLVAGSGTANLIGGLGSDLFIVNSSTDTVSDADFGQKAGIDTIQSSASYTLPNTVNILILTGTSNLSARGNLYADEIIGNGGTDVLTAGNGNDTLVAGSGVATLIGGSGNNTFIINSTNDVVQESIAGHNNALYSAVSYTLPTNINSLVLTGSSPVKGTANSGNDSIIGGAGATTLVAGSGADTLIAGTGLATFVGGTGSAVYVVDNASDIIQSASASATNAVFSSATYVLPTNVNKLTLTGIASIAGTGNSVSDMLTAGAGQDTLFAGSGAATLIGGAGNDTFVVNSLSDLVQDSSTTTSNTVQSTVNDTLVANVNTLAFSGTAALKGTANAGTDTLMSNSGLDTLFGSSGNDTFVINNSSDIVQDTSTTAVNVAQSSVTYSLVTNVNTLILSGTAALKGIANGGADTLISNTGVDSLFGGSGNDIFIVNNALDVVQDTFGSTSNLIESSVAFTLPTNVAFLTLIGTAALTASGNTAADVITANSGADTLIAGSGVATLTGGSGNDTFIINNVSDVLTDTATLASNTVQSSVTFSLATNLNSLMLTGTMSLTGTANTANDTLASNSGVDTLVGGSGHDLFVINNAADVILNGNSTDSIESSVNYTLPSNISNLLLIGSANVIGTGNGNYGSDVISAGAGIDTLVAGAGYYETLIGGGANDTFIVNSFSDVVENPSTTNSDTVSSSASYYSLPANVDTLILSGSAALQAIGNTDASNVIYANSGNDSVVATAYSNTINGGTGSDSLYASPYVNLIYAGNGGTSLQPTYIYANASGTNVTTQSTIYGGSGADYLQGGPGSDLIYAGSGVDTLISGTGHDSLYGSAGSTLVDSLSGYDLLTAGAGNETIYALGLDTLVAGSGADQLGGEGGQLPNSSALSYDFAAGFGQATIGMANTGPDTLNFATGLEPGSFTVSIVPASLFGEGGGQIYDPALVLQDGVESITIAFAFGPGVVSSLNFADTGSESLKQFMNTYGPGFLDLTDDGYLIGYYGTPAQDYFSTGTGKTVFANGFQYAIWASGDDDILTNTAAGNLGIYAYGDDDTITGSTVWTSGNSDSITLLNAQSMATLAGANDTVVGDTNQQSFALEQSTDVIQAPSGQTNDSLDAFFNDTLPTGFAQMILDSTVGGLAGTSNALGGLLIAGASFDTLTGSAGSDTLIASSTNDLLIGGSGSESYVLNSASDQIVFGSGAASLTSVQAAFSYTLTGAANTLLETGASAVGAANSGNDSLSAYGSGDTLVAGPGNDTLWAAYGAPTTLIGGSGNDTFIVANSNALIIDTATTASNIVLSVGSYSLPTYVNTLVLSSTYATGTANSGNDSLVATAAFDQLIAGPGSDTLVAGAQGTTFIINAGFGHELIVPTHGGDTIEFGAGINESSLTFTAVPGTGGAAPSLVIAGDGGVVTVQGGLVPGAISSINFTGGSDYTVPQLVAPTGRTTVTGTSGNLILTSNNNDTVLAGSGQDTVIAWGNNDTLTAGAGGTLIYAGGLNDSVVGGAATDSLDAIGAINTLVGGTGNETFIVNDPTTVIQVAAGGHDTVQSSVNYTVPTNITQLTLIGTAALTATGNAATDTIIGNTGYDTLIGGAAADLLIGGSLADTFVINNTADTVTPVSGLANDTIRSLLANYTLPTSVNNLMVGAGDTGTGNAGNDYLVGGGGSLVTAGSGRDTLSGQNFDTLVAGSGPDFLLGTGSATLITNASVVDTLQGSGAYNKLYINNSADVVTSLNGDSIYTALNYTLSGNVTGVTWYLTGTAALTASDQTQSGATFYANSGHDTLISASGGSTFNDSSGGAVEIGAGNNNTFNVNSVLDVVSATGSLGNELYTTVSYSLPTNVNLMQITGPGITGYGNAANDTFVASNGAAVIAGTGADSLVAFNNGNTLTAGSGNDTLVPNVGYGAEDTLVFNSGFGTAIVDGTNDSVGPTIEFGTGINASSLSLTAALDPTGAAALKVADGASTVTLDTISNGDTYQFSFAGASALTLAQFLSEVTVTTSSLAGASGNVILEGAASTSVMGGSGRDTLYAGAGHDTLIGASVAQNLNALGNFDSIVGGAGGGIYSAYGSNDTLVGGAGADTLFGPLGGSTTYVVSRSSDHVVDQANAFNDTVESSINYALPSLVGTLVLTGTAALTGTGSSSGFDTLVANTGADTFYGNGASDTFVINSVADVIYAEPTSGNQVDVSFSYTLPTYINSLLFTGTAALTGTGNSVADTLTSNSGVDTLVGNAASDVFVVNNAADVIQDTAGSVTNVLQSTVSFTLPLNVNRLMLTGTGNLLGTGNTATDSLVGGSGLDTLIAGSGTDTLVAGSGLTTMIGGSGNDVFVVNNTNDAVQDTSTTATNSLQSSANYSLAVNVNSLTLTGTSALLGTANGATDTLTSNTGVDTLVGGAGNDTFVVNNSGDVVQDTDATTTNAAKSGVSYSLTANVNTLIFTGSASLVGSANGGNDSITGNSGNNTLVGGAGIDTLVAGSGIATLIGGSGNTTFVINSTSDVLQDTFAAAINTLRSSVTYSLIANVNALVLTGTVALKGTANNGADTLTSNSGVDTLVGGTGNDTFVISNASDVVQDGTAAMNLILSTVTVTLPTNVNALTFTGSTALHGTGNAGNDSMTANTGADTLTAGNGTDTLVSSATGSAIDSLVGGTGTDLFFVNYAGDIVNVGSTHGVDTIESSASYTAATNVANLTLSGTSALVATGNATFSDTLVGNSGADTLTAGAVADTLVGGSGNDTFVVNNAGDVVQDTSTTATNIIQSSVSYTLPTNVNRLILAGTAALVGTANTGNDTLTANTGADTLVSGSGTAVDSLIGGTGADLFVVNNAFDTVTVGGTHGVDTIQSSVSYSASANVASLTLTGNTALVGTGSSLAGIITANSGNDTLTAIASTDTLVGGSGTDLFVVNNASQVVSLGTSGTSDTIQSSVSYTLPTNVQYLTLSGSSALTGVGNSLTDLIVGNTGNDSITGGTGIAVLEGGRTAGSDRISATSNQAALIAGAGSSTLTGGAYKDFYAAGLVSDSITTGATANVVAVNKGDGATTLQPTTSATNVLSLGAGIDTESLYFTKTGNNLILTDAVSGDSITLTNWYVAASDQDITTLQVVEIASASYNSAGSDALRNKALEAFNFTSLVSAFNTAGSPANWALSTAMPSASLATSSTADYGGDLAYYFGLNGNLTGVNLSAAQSTLTNASFGTATQTIDPFANISGGGGLHLLVAHPEDPRFHEPVSRGKWPDEARGQNAVPENPLATAGIVTPVSITVIQLSASDTINGLIVSSVDGDPNLRAGSAPAAHAIDPSSTLSSGTGLTSVRSIPEWRAPIPLDGSLSAFGRRLGVTERPATSTNILTPGQLSTLLSPSDTSQGWIVHPREGDDVRVLRKTAEAPSNMLGAQKTSTSSAAIRRIVEPDDAGKTTSSVDPPTYVDPINVAWARLHAQFDVAASLRTGAETAIENEALGAGALPASLLSHTEHFASNGDLNGGLKRGRAM